MSVSPKQLVELLKGYFGIHEPVLVTGAPGIGKSNIIEDAARAAGHNLLLSHPVTADPTDAKGLPWPVAGGDHATFLPFGDLYQAINATTPTVWFLDDLGQASPAVQASFMQLLLARRVNGHVLPDCVTFAAATNRRGDRAGVSGVLEPVKSRFGTIVELTPTIEDWSPWALNNGVSPMLVAHLRNRPDRLSAFQPTADLTQSPSPRTWFKLSRAESLKLSPAVETAAFIGAVGEGDAVEYLTYRAMYRNLVNVDAILLDPSKAKIPTAADQLYAICTGLAHRANETNFPRISTYAQRLMTEADRGEFAALMVRDCTRRDEKIQYSDAYVRLHAGPFGQLISGRD